MYKSPTEEYDRMFVTSDTHFGHNKEFLYAKRGYKSPQEMDEDIIQTINKTVGPDGILLHLGDFCLNTSWDRYKDILRQLRIGEIWMLHGNHNNPWNRAAADYTAMGLTCKVKFLGHYFTFTSNGKFFVCFHFPIQVWDGRGKGAFHLCGHSHGDLQYSLPQNKESKILDCGWDVFRKPISLSKEVEKIMRTKNANDIHHKSIEVPIIST